MDYMKEYVYALKNGTSYDFICNHYTAMSKEDLAEIIKQFDFAIEFRHEDYLYDDVIDELESSLED